MTITPPTSTTQLPDERKAPGDQIPKPRLSLRDAQKLLTRDRLLDAAYEVFTQVGYRQTTIDQITAHAGANRATFYLHFKDKIEVAAGLARRSSGEAAHAFMRLDEIDNPTLKNVRAWLDEYLKDISRDRMLTQMLNEAISTEPEFGAEYFAYIARIADRMTNTLSRFGGKQREVARSKIVLVQIMIGRYVCHTLGQGLSFPGKYQVEALAESVWSVLFSGAGLAPSPAKAKKSPAVKQQGSQGSIT